MRSASNFDIARKRKFDFGSFQFLWMLDIRDLVNACLVCKEWSYYIMSSANKLFSKALDDMTGKWASDLHYKQRYKTMRNWENNKFVINTVEQETRISEWMERKGWPPVHEMRHSIDIGQKTHDAIFCYSRNRINYFEAYKTKQLIGEHPVSTITHFYWPFIISDVYASEYDFTITNLETAEKWSIRTEGPNFISCSFDETNLKLGINTMWGKIEVFTLGEDTHEILDIGGLTQILSFVLNYPIITLMVITDILENSYKCQLREYDIRSGNFIRSVDFFWGSPNKTLHPHASMGTNKMYFYTWYLDEAFGKERAVFQLWRHKDLRKVWQIYEKRMAIAMTDTGIHIHRGPDAPFLVYSFLHVDSATMASGVKKLCNIQ